MPAALHQFTVIAEQADQTLAALLRHWLPGQSWSQVRKLVAGRRVKLNGELWLDDKVRLAPPSRQDETATSGPRIVHVDVMLDCVGPPDVRHALRQFLEKAEKEHDY